MPRRCGQCASLRATTRKQQPTQKKRRTTSTHHYGQQPTIAGIARHCGLRPANNSSSKKKRRTTTPTITDKAPSLRATRVIAGYDPQTTADEKKTSDNNAHHYGQSPVVAGNARHCGLRPATQQPTQKKRRTTTPTITDNAPSLRATTRKPATDAKKSVKQQRPPLRTKPRRCGIRPATPQLTTADAKKTSDKKKQKNKNKMKKQTKTLLATLIATAALTAALTTPATAKNYFVGITTTWGTVEPGDHYPAATAANLIAAV
ncbi:MAG: hypothetical protein LBG17_05775, partial [Bacteroidales bacterium]|nr:hypothetical protein [Bacteroidales bacterium]